MFASKVTREVIIKDGDSEVSVTIRKLSRRALDAASMKKQSEVARVAREMGAEMVEAYRSRNAEEKAEAVVDPAEARFTAYDVETVLVNGIASWSADVPVAEGIADLDEPTSKELFRAIITLSVPTPEEAEAEQGKP
jgi:hypothetical protein